MTRFSNSTKYTRPQSSSVSGTIVEEVRRSWIKSLDLIQEQILKRATPSVQEALALLESLPLATEEFASARLRLANVEQYAHAREWGAARFELKMLAIVAQ